MAAFKDKEAVAEALRGGSGSAPKVKLKKIWVLFLSAAVVLGAVAAVFKARGTGPAAISKAVVADKAEAQPTAQKPAEPAAQPAVARKAEPEVIVMPPVRLVEKSAPAKSRSTALPAARAPGLFAQTRTSLRAGAYGEALARLKESLPSAQSEAELKEAAVLEARALLAQGKLEEARKKFEPLAFMTAESETGADALLGNFWCQAGSLGRCRDAELEIVRGGAASWGGAMAALEAARRIEEKAAGEVPALERARALFQQALDSGKLEESAEKDCLAHLDDLTHRLILDPRIACSAPKSVFHRVEAGDVLEKIARKYKVNQGQIKRINRLNDKLIVRSGQNLKILPGDVVFKADRTRLNATLYIDGVFIRRYPIGIGPGDATPLGSYTVERKVVNPDWYYDGKRIPFGDPKNILGTRWMAFSEADNSGRGSGLGVHGTALPESVPGRESKGCIRMINKDVEELYDFMPQGGKVEISD